MRKDLRSSDAKLVVLKVKAIEWNQLKPLV